LAAQGEIVPVTRGRLFLIALPAALMLAAASWLLAKTNLEPKYAGHSLGYWTQQYCGLEDPEAAAAIQAIGTNAIPDLLAALQSKPPISERLGSARKKLLRRIGIRTGASPYFPKAFAASTAFKALGTNAIPAIPVLLQVAADPSHPVFAHHALDALGSMGDLGAPALLTAARDKSHPYRRYAILTISVSDYSEYHDEVVANLKNILHDEDLRMSQQASRAIARIANSSAAVVFN